MSGNDLRYLLLDPALKQARRLAGHKGLIALGACVLIVLPMCWAHSRSNAPAPLDPSDGLTVWAPSSDSLTLATNESMLPVWSELPGLPAEHTPDAALRGEGDSSVASFTVYPSAAPSLTEPSTAMDKQELMAEVQRRLARMMGGVTMPITEPPRTSSRPTAVMSPPRTSSVSLALDANAPLQLFEPSGGSAPAATRKSVPPAAEPTVALDSGRDPNLISSPAAQAAFVRHFETAQAFQRQGQYTRAADAFTLALAYRPNDANAYLGKGLALFAAGQYAGSGAALARAVELDAQIALQKVDLVKVTSGADEFITRFTDLVRHAETHAASEPHFLLAYIYYQADQWEQARTAVEAAQAGSIAPASVQAMIAALDRQGRR